MSIPFISVISIISAGQQSVAKGGVVWGGVRVFTCPQTPSVRGLLYVSPRGRWIGPQVCPRPGLKATSVKPEMKRDPEAIRPTMRAVLSFFFPPHPSFVLCLTQFKTQGIFFGTLDYIWKREKIQRKQVHHKIATVGNRWK